MPQGTEPPKGSPTQASEVATRADSLWSTPWLITKEHVLFDLGNWIMPLLLEAWWDAVTASEDDGAEEPVTATDAMAPPSRTEQP